MILYLNIIYKQYNNIIYIKNYKIYLLYTIIFYIFYIYKYLINDIYVYISYIYIYMWNILTIDIWSSSMLPWDSVFVLTGLLTFSLFSCETISGSGFTILVATKVISFISSGLSPDPDIDPVDDFLNLFLRKDGDNGEGLGEQDSPRSPPPGSLPLGHFVKEALCISASPFIFKLSAV